MMDAYPLTTLTQFYHSFPQSPTNAPRISSFWQQSSTRAPLGLRVLVEGFGLWGERDGVKTSRDSSLAWFTCAIEKSQKGNCHDQMMKALRESKAKLSELVERASRGEDVITTVHGKAKARLTRVQPQNEGGNATPG